MSAPSFSSFPPSFASFPESEPGPSKSRKDGSQSRRNDDKETRERSKYKRRGRDKSEKRKHGKGYAESLNLDDETSKMRVDLERSTVEESRRFFYVDQRGDPLNITYGGLHSGDVPKYHIFGGGRSILGLSAAWVGLRRNGKGIEVGLAGRRKMTSLTDSSTGALLALPPKHSILQAGNDYKHEEIDGFLPLPSRRGGRNPEDTYRSIATRINDSSEESSSEPDTLSGSEDSENNDQPQLPAHQATSKLLEQELSTNPASVTTWLSLLSHSLSTIPLTTKNAIKARSEISCSILSRALAASAQNAASQILRLKYLRSGEEIWHESKLRAEWDAAFTLGGIDIWMEWLEWRIRKGKAGLEGILEDAAKVLQALGSDDENEVGKVRVLWRVAIVLHSAGYTERATAIFQAQAELTFKLPQVLKGLPLHAQVDQLEGFWEAEVPRIGESGAKGWSAWVASGGVGPEPTQPHPMNPPEKYLPNSDPYTLWALNELHVDRTSRLPTRSKDESEDPYATILFSDIRTMLSSLNTHRAQHLFKLVWVSFIGLHVPGLSVSQNHDNWDDRWSHIHLCTPAFMDVLFPTPVGRKQIMTDAVAGVVVGREKEYQRDFGPVRNWGRGVFGPFDVGIHPTSKGKDAGGFWGKETLKIVDQGLVRLIFKQLKLEFGNFEWDSLTLAFESVLNIKSALKLSRSFLADKPDSPLHWGIHAQLERIRGKLPDARKVYQTILPPSLEPTARNRMGRIWWEWAQLEWLCGRPSEALDIVLRSAGVTGRAGVVILRGKRQLEEVIRSVEGGANWKEREAWVKLRALLELLTTSDIRDALSVFDDHLQSEVWTLEHESMTVACLLMMQHHSVELRNPTPPDILRTRVERALEQYPSHSLILGLFLKGEKGQGVWGRIRAMLGESGGKAKDVARRVEEVWIAGWETGRWESEIERTRGGLAAAVEHERTRTSPIIWRIYLEFEIRAGEFQRAKKIFFRAIGECPLNKELYLLAFTALREVFSRGELNALSDTMMERGIRVRQELDVDLDAERTRVGDQVEEGMDEIEKNASELRRLMPY